MVQHNVFGKTYLCYVCYGSKRIQCRWMAKDELPEGKEGVDKNILMHNKS